MSNPWQAGIDCMSLTSLVSADLTSRNLHFPRSIMPASLTIRNRVLITKDFVELYYHFFSRPGFQSFLLRIVRLVVTVRGAREEILKPIVDNLEKIKQPVLIVWGKEDRVLPLKHGYFAKQKLPNATLEIVEGCEHLTFFERPDVFNRLVLTFLSCK